MAKKSSDGPARGYRRPLNREPRLRVLPDSVREGRPFELQGSNWSDCPLEISVGRKRLVPQRIAGGSPIPGGIRPDPKGSFLVTLSSEGLGEGKHRIAVTSARRDQKETARVRLTVLR